MVGGRGAAGPGTGNPGAAPALLHPEVPRGADEELRGFRLWSPINGLRIPRCLCLFVLTGGERRTHLARFGSWEPVQAEQWLGASLHRQ